MFTMYTSRGKGKACDIIEQNLKKSDYLDYKNIDSSYKFVKKY